MATPQRGVAFDFSMELGDASDPDTYRTNPTIAAGDFKISKDGGNLANLTTLPVVTPAGSTQVWVQLSAAEMTADHVRVFAVDQTDPKEWQDTSNSIDIPVTNLDSIADAVWQVVLPEDYAADNTEGTGAQMLYLIQQNLGEFSIVGDLRTVRQLDGSNEAAVYLLDDDTNPTGTTRQT